MHICIHNFFPSPFPTANDKTGMEVRAESEVRRDDGGCEVVEVTARKQVKDGGKSGETKAGEGGESGGQAGGRRRE